MLPTLLQKQVLLILHAISEEWSDFNIKVNCVIPRRAATPMRFKAFPNEDPTTLLKPEKVSEKVIGYLEEIYRSNNTR